MIPGSARITKHNCHQFLLLNKTIPRIAWISQIIARTIQIYGYLSDRSHCSGNRSDTSNAMSVSLSNVIYLDLEFQGLKSTSGIAAFSVKLFSSVFVHTLRHFAVSFDGMYEANSFAHLGSENYQFGDPQNKSSLVVFTFRKYLDFSQISCSLFCLFELVARRTSASQPYLPMALWVW